MCVWYSPIAHSYMYKGKDKWFHLVELAEKSMSESGLYIGKKLTTEHVRLTSYSRMNVHLAAQVNFEE